MRPVMAMTMVKPQKNGECQNDVAPPLLLLVPFALNTGRTIQMGKKDIRYAMVPGRRYVRADLVVPFIIRTIFHNAELQGSIPVPL